MDAPRMSRERYTNADRYIGAPDGTGAGWLSRPCRYLCSPEPSRRHRRTAFRGKTGACQNHSDDHRTNRSEEHTSELQSLMRISYAVFCLKKKKPTRSHTHTPAEPNNHDTKNI